jgi:hypothetical protein
MEKENVVKKSTPDKSALDKTAAAAAEKLQNKKADAKRETLPDNSFDS